MTTLHFATRNVERSTAFYRTLLDREPKRRYEDLAIFEVDTLIIELAKSTKTVDADDRTTYGFVVPSAEIVERQARRLKRAGATIDLRVAEDCCHSLQTKVWTVDPDGRRWKTYAVLNSVADKDPWQRLLDLWKWLFGSPDTFPDDVVTDSLERKFFERQLRNYSYGLRSKPEQHL